MRKKYFIDTCVLLNDPQAIFKFEENDLYIPLAVIDDLDEIKTRKGSTGWAAREVFRILDQLNIKELTNGGADVNEFGGKAFIYNPEKLKLDVEVPQIIRVNSDNALINACLSMQSIHPEDEVIIVTKDVGLRVRAMSWGCKAENYKNDLIENSIFSGIKCVEIDNEKSWNQLWGNDSVVIDSLSENIKEQIGELAPNEFVMFEWGENKCASIHKNKELKILKDKSNGSTKLFMGIKAHNIEQKCALEILSDDNLDLVVMEGRAGTGKSILSLAVALDKIINQGVYDKLVLIKPLIPVGGQDIGSLPGDKLEKLYHWFGPFRDNIAQLISTNNKSVRQPAISFDELVEKDVIEVEAMTYIQGRSIPNSIIILDEGQNISSREARMVVERCGKNSKVILLGDLSQVENPYLDNRSCGLAHAMNGSKFQETCACITLNKVERSSLAAIASEIFQHSEN